MNSNTETNNEVSLSEIYSAAKLFQVPGVTVSAGGGSISVSCDVNKRNSLPTSVARQLVVNTRAAIGCGLAAMFPSRKFVRQTFNGKNVSAAGHWNMGVFHTSSVSGAVKVVLTEGEQFDLIRGISI